MSRSPTPLFGQPRADRTSLGASVIPSIVVLLLLVLAPQRAAACYGCYGATAARPVFGASIPADGVLAFAFEGEHPSGAAVALRRLGGDGAELELTLETLAPHLVGAPLLIARPLAPLEVGATYEVALSAVNDSTTIDESDCELAPHLEVFTTVRADPAGHVAPTPPELDVVFTVDVVTTTPPDAEVVCCDRDDQPDVGRGVPAALWVRTGPERAADEGPSGIVRVLADTAGEVRVGADRGAQGAGAGDEVACCGRDAERVGRVAQGCGGGGGEALDVDLSAWIPGGWFDVDRGAEDAEPDGRGAAVAE
ncbi:MAG: hypothetical protein IPK80_13185 [Nannocystis sp.]|nr:hypothetical protein [Nannocystis sp.]